MSDGVSEFYFGPSADGIRLRVVEKPCKVSGTEVPVDAPQAVSVTYSAANLVWIVEYLDHDGLCGLFSNEQAAQACLDFQHECGYMAAMSRTIPADRFER